MYTEMLYEYRRDAVKKLELYRQSKVVDANVSKDSNTQVN
jgi:hypothetical protein